MYPKIDALVCPCCGSWIQKEISKELIKHFNRFDLDTDGHILINGSQRIFYFKNVKLWTEDTKKRLNLALETYKVKIINANNAINGVSANVVIEWIK